MKRIYLCDDTPEGIFTAVYDGWAAKLPDEQISLYVERGHEFELFADYTYVQTDQEKAKKVVRTVSRQLGRNVYDMIFSAALSYEKDKVNSIYRFLKLGFRVGSTVEQMHGEEVVCRIFELKRSVWNEAHYMKEFLRFHETEEGILLARINPKNGVLPLIAEHFSDRFPEEHFVVLDEVHEMGLFHEKGKQWYLIPLDLEVLNDIWNHKVDSPYEKLWKTFFKTISIKERENYKCQRTNCAIRYRDYMLEFH
ncbi:MAG: TIGR03915 family putative DNA repair protein [Lachnospiraceae bacterium]|nr:TIGR03915 family putative DNA repair protein [Lachnospiraceae bacterium]